MWNLNRNEELRDEIIFGEYEPEKYVGGIRRFDNLPVDKIKELADLNFLYEFDRQNSCPSIETIMKFMKKYPGYEACGYVVSKKREDYRVSLDGLEKVGEMAMPEIEEFMRVFCDADELTATSTGVRCWFD